MHGMVLDGVLTRNEARISEGYNPIVGLDEPLIPMNVTTVANADKLAEQKRLSAPAAPVPDARAVALAQSAAQRVARKELQVVKVAAAASNQELALAEAYDKHAVFVATCLGVALDAAQQYCAARRHSFRDGTLNGTLEDDFMASAVSILERLALKGSI